MDNEKKEAPAGGKDGLIKKINELDEKLIRSVVENCDGLLKNKSLLYEKPESPKDKLSHKDFLDKALIYYADEGKKKTDILSSLHKEVSKEWERLIQTSIAALRRNDAREPFQSETHRDNIPSAYGVPELRKFFSKFIEFEEVLYGADRWYRDHVIHAYRVWLLGVDFLLRMDSSGEPIIDIFAKNLAADVASEIQGKTPNELFKYTHDEILSVWTILSLTHDLGYPLEKVPRILAYIQEMMANFVSSPELQHDLRLNAAADTINEYIVRFISTKMILCRDYTELPKAEKIFTGRIQPKFYIKFTKSLEESKHGIISSILLYKKLLFFLESDCNIHEDYRFNLEETRQFYLRREILRAMAAHTCTDIYQMYATNFSFLLFFCDELQDWARSKYHKLIDNEIYYYPPQIDAFSTTEIKISQEYEIAGPADGANEKIKISAVSNAAKRIRSEYDKFKTVYRDGIDTIKRAFSYTKIITLTGLSKPIIIKYAIPKNSKATICYKVNSRSLDHVTDYTEQIEEQNIPHCQD